MKYFSEALCMISGAKGLQNYTQTVFYRNEIQETLAHLRAQHKTHVYVKTELESKPEELRNLKKDFEDAKQDIGDKEQQIKDLEKHFVIRRFVFVAFV